MIKALLLFLALSDLQVAALSKRKCPNRGLGQGPSYSPADTTNVDTPDTSATAPGADAPSASSYAAPGTPPGPSHGTHGNKPSTKPSTPAPGGYFQNSTSATSGTASPKPGADGSFMLNIPGRYQYDENNGYCGELSLQQSMMKYGVWIPQEAARKAGGGELLLGINYEKAMKALLVNYHTFTGSGYDAFVQWTIKHMKEGKPVIEVAYYKGGPDSDYDHIMPVVGYKPSPETLFVNSGYSEKPVARLVSDYSCSASNKKDSIEKSGCVPTNVKYGHAILGPTYNTNGISLDLSVSSSKEPGLGKSAPFSGSLKISGLQQGSSYKIMKSGSGDPASGQQVATFTADGPEHTHSVSFQSGTIAYFGCVKA